MSSCPDQTELVVHPDFDGHPARDFASMTAEERLDDLSRKIALVLELRKARLGQISDGPAAPGGRG